MFCGQRQGIRQTWLQATESRTRFAYGRSPEGLRAGRTLCDGEVAIARPDHESQLISRRNGSAVSNGSERQYNLRAQLGRYSLGEVVIPDLDGQNARVGPLLPGRKQVCYIRHRASTLPPGRTLHVRPNFLLKWSSLWPVDGKLSVPLGAGVCVSEGWGCAIPG